MFTEYEVVIRRDAIFKQSPVSLYERHAFLDDFLNVCEWVSVYYLWRPNLRDEADNHVLELAGLRGMKKMSMKTPVHPGSLVREDCIKELGLTIKAAAEQLGVTRQTLSNLVNEKSALTPEMSIRLEKLGWGRAGQRIRIQANYDLA